MKRIHKQKKKTNQMPLRRTPACLDLEALCHFRQLRRTPAFDDLVALHHVDDSCNTDTADEDVPKVETEMRDDPEAIPASGTSTGSGSSSSGTGGTSGGSSSGGTGNGIVTDASGASGIALGLAGSVAFVLSALI